MTRLIKLTLGGWLLITCCTGCKKNTSHYYADNDTPGVAIFSNTGNNVMSCLVDGHPWRTRARQAGAFFGSGISDLIIKRIRTSSLTDTLLITWKTDQTNQDMYDVVLTLPVAKNFQWKDIAAYQGKRLVIDSSNGFFSLYQDIFPVVSGKGIMYFNTAHIDSTGQNNISGRIAGLLQADFYPVAGSPKTITSGRFDDDISNSELSVR